MASATETAATLPADNAARLAIYDVLHDAARGAEAGTAMPEDELFARVLPRLRILVPRELHLAGERTYFQKKLDVCVGAGLILVSQQSAGGRSVVPTARAPHVRYPDGTLRDYLPGLEPARERLDSDNASLRVSGFDLREVLPSAADDPEGAEFRRLLDSMREHGFLRQFPVVRHEDGLVLDGRARLLAAATLGFEVEYLKEGSARDQALARRRDTPLDRILVALDANVARLPAEAIDDARAGVARVTGRAWEATEADLALTQEWRRTAPTEHAVTFEVRRIAYRGEQEARVQVTDDRKVMLRSLIRAAGLDGYKIDVLRDHVPFEQARSAHSGGRKAVFVRVEDLIPGIENMLAERRVSRRKIDPEWAQIRDWLLEVFDPAPA